MDDGSHVILVAQLQTLLSAVLIRVFGQLHFVSWCLNDSLCFFYYFIVETTINYYFFLNLSK